MILDSMVLDSPPRRIVCAAMLMDDGYIVPGVRHFSPDMRAVLRRLYGSGFKLFGVWIIKPYHMRVYMQGFVDTHGAFLDRYEAWNRAVLTGQILNKNGIPEGELYSEHLY